MPLARLRALAAQPRLLVRRLLHGGAQLGRALGARLLALVEGGELGLGLGWGLGLGIRVGVGVRVRGMAGDWVRVRKEGSGWG